MRRRSKRTRSAEQSLWLQSVAEKKRKTQADGISGSTSNRTHAECGLDATEQNADQRTPTAPHEKAVMQPSSNTTQVGAGDNLTRLDPNPTTVVGDIDFAQVFRRVEQTTNPEIDEEEDVVAEQYSYGLERGPGIIEQTRHLDYDDDGDVGTEQPCYVRSSENVSGHDHSDDLECVLSSEEEEGDEGVMLNNCSAAGRDASASSTRQPISDIITYTQAPGQDLLLRKKLRRWKSRFSLTCLTLLTGSVRFSVKQYDILKCFPLAMGEVSCDDREGSLPSYNTVRRLFQSVMKDAHPSMTTVKFTKSDTLIRKQVVEEGDNEQCDDPTNLALESNGEENIDPSGKVRVRIIPPSSWARIDIATPSVFDFLYEEEDVQGLHRRTLQSSSIVTNRYEVVHPHEYLFAERNGTTVAAHPGSFIECSIEGTVPPLTHNYVLSGVCDGQYSLHGMIVACWCVGSDNVLPSAGKALSNKNLPGTEVAVVRHFSTKRMATRRSGVGGVDYIVRPGDHCTLLRTTSQGGESQGTFVVVVHRFWKDADGIPSTSIIWCTAQSDDEVRPRARLKQVVNKCKLLTDGPRYSPSDQQLVRAPKKRVSTRLRGRLQDGTKYVVYRVLLYCDDFKPTSSLYPQGSAGGFYLLPIGLPPEARRTTSAIRVVSLTPPGVSTNKVLHFIVDDLVRATVEGIDGTTPSGEKVRIFVDVIGFIGDYPASAHTIDVMGHMARAPCTHCSFRKADVHHVSTSRNGYTGTVHNRNSAFMRTAERHKAIRREGISEEGAKRLGMKEDGRVGDVECPLLYLQDKLDEHQDRIPVDMDGSQVVSGMFDPYLCNVVAPDHLLSGLAINAMDAIFKVLPSESRELADCYIVSALSENGLLKQKNVCNPRTSKMNSMSLSAVFCVLSVAAHVLDNAVPPNNELGVELIQLLQKLNRLVSFTYWWPEEHLDGHACVDLVTGSGRDKYHRDLQNMATEYVSTVNKLCAEYPHLKAQLDKPNVHRILELYYHSVPIFGHAREFNELVFEHAHQPLKRSIARSNFKDAHLSAVDHAIANDWQGRVASLHADTRSEDAQTRCTGKTGLRSLMVGRHWADIDEERQTELKREVDNAIAKQFNDTLLKMFQQQALVSGFASKSYSIWKATRVTPARHVAAQLATGEEMSEITKYAAGLLSSWYPRFEQDTVAHANIDFVEEARRVRVRMGNESVVVSLDGHEVIRTGCAVQARVPVHIDDVKMMVPSTEESTQARIFAVIQVAQPRKTEAEEVPWALVVQCTVSSRRRLRLKNMISKSNVKWLKLTNSVRRIGLYHDCESERTQRGRCAADKERRSIRHNGSILGGSTMLYQTRRDGYPPRMG